PLAVGPFVLVDALINFVEGHGRLGPKSKVQSPRSRSQYPTLDIGLWTLDRVRQARATPRRRSTSCWVRRCLRASIVALTTVTALPVLKLLVMTFLIPAASQTARTAEPAMTPVPASAGISITSAEPYLART